MEQIGELSRWLNAERKDVEVPVTRLTGDGISKVLSPRPATARFGRAVRRAPELGANDRPVHQHPELYLG